MITYQRTYQSDSEGLVDVNELRDDVTGRWEHEKDGYLGTWVKENWELRDWEKTPDFGARRQSAVDREARFLRLSFWLEAQRVKMVLLRKRGNKEKMDRIRRNIEACVKGVSERYAKSVRLIVDRKQGEWWLLYLKREQKDDLITLARDAWRGK